MNQEIAQLKALVMAQNEKIRYYESLQLEERIRKLENLELHERIMLLESLKFEELISQFQSFKDEVQVEMSKLKTRPEQNLNRSSAGTPTQSSPVVLSIPTTPVNDRCNQSTSELNQSISASSIIQQLPFSGAISALTAVLSNPITVFGNQIPSPMSAAQSLTLLPPLKALSSFSKWARVQSISSMSSSLITTAHRLYNSPSRNVGPGV